MTQTGDAILATAQSYNGTWEWAGKENNPVVVGFYAAAGHPEIKQDEVPWCAAFAGAVLAQLGLPNTGSLLAKSYLGYGDPVEYSVAEPGDIVILNRGQNWQGHIGFLVRKQGDTFWIIGGNQGDQVNVKSYHRDQIAGIRRPSTPRQSLSQSTTLQATAGGLLSTGVGAVTAVSQLSGPAQIVVLGVLGIVAVAFLWVARERISKWLYSGAR